MLTVIVILLILLLALQALDAFMTYKLDAKGVTHWNLVMAWAINLGGIGPALMVAKFLVIVTILASFQLLYGWWLIPFYLFLIVGYGWVSWRDFRKLGWNIVESLKTKKG